MEGGLREPSLPSPRLPFVQEEASSEERREPLQPEALPVVRVIVAEHVLHVLGPPEEIEVERTPLAGCAPATDDVAVLAKGREHEAQRIAADRVEQAEWRQVSRSRSVGRYAVWLQHRLREEQCECHIEMYQNNDSYEYRLRRDDAATGRKDAATTRDAHGP